MKRKSPEEDEEVVKSHSTNKENLSQEDKNFVFYLVFITRLENKKSDAEERNTMGFVSSSVREARQKMRDGSSTLWARRNDPGVLYTQYPLWMWEYAVIREYVWLLETRKTPFIACYKLNECRHHFDASRYEYLWLESVFRVAHYEKKYKVIEWVLLTIDTRDKDGIDVLRRCLDFVVRRMVDSNKNTAKVFKSSKTGASKGSEGAIRGATRGKDGSPEATYKVFTKPTKEFEIIKTLSEKGKVETPYLFFRVLTFGRLYHDNRLGMLPVLEPLLYLAEHWKKDDEFKNGHGNVVIPDKLWFYIFSRCKNIDNVMYCFRACQKFKLEGYCPGLPSLFQKRIDMVKGDCDNAIKGLEVSCHSRGYIDTVKEIRSM